MDEIALVGGRVLGGLLAGVYVAFAVAVMPALHRLDDATFARVMNQVNDVIVNPAFMLVFLGAPTVTAALLIWDRSPLTVLAAVLAVAALVITVAGNVPLNDALASGGSRAAYENPWLAWHIARTVAATASFALLARAL